MTSPTISSDEALDSDIEYVLRDAEDALSTARMFGNGASEECQKAKRGLAKIRQALSHPAAQVPEVGADRVRADDFWPINSTEGAQEPIVRPRIDWWWLCKKIEFQRRELKQLNEWLKVYRDREAALNQQPALKQERITISQTLHEELRSMLRRYEIQDGGHEAFCSRRAIEEADQATAEEIPGLEEAIAEADRWKTASDAAKNVLFNPTKEKHRIFEYENGISVVVQMEAKGVSVRVLQNLGKDESFEYTEDPNFMPDLWEYLAKRKKLK